jgi:ubiquinol-cytochrome c reductase cytochrome b subunit
MLAAGVVAVLVVLAVTVTINPVWLYGPADPGNAWAGAGAVWYMAFLDGAQRLVPPGLEFPLWGGTLTLAVLLPVAVIGAYFAAAIVYPWVEGWIVGDRGGTFEPQRPRTTPTRTGIGVAAMIFYGVLWAAAGADTIAFQFHLDFGSVILTLQLALLFGPLAGYMIAKRVCLGLQRKDRDLLAHGRETGRIVRLPGGEYYEVHAPVGKAERDSILAGAPAEPMRLRPARDGRMLVRDVVRARLSRWFSGDRVEPATSPAPAASPRVGRTRPRPPTADS